MSAGSMHAAHAAAAIGTHARHLTSPHRGSWLPRMFSICQPSNSTAAWSCLHVDHWSDTVCWLSSMSGRCLSKDRSSQHPPAPAPGQGTSILLGPGDDSHVPADQHASGHSTARMLSGLGFHCPQLLPAWALFLRWRFTVDRLMDLLPELIQPHTLLICHPA